MVTTILRRKTKGEYAMNNKWFLKLMGSLLAVFLITGCNTDDQNPPPEDNGLHTPGEDLNNNDLDHNVTPEEDVVPGDNNLNNNGTNNNNGLDKNNDLNRDNNDGLGTNGNNVNPGGTGGAGGTGNK